MSVHLSLKPARRASIVWAGLLAALLSSPGLRGQEVPFDPSGAVMISEKENLMAHVPSPCILPDGTALVLYYRDLYQEDEDRVPTTELVMDEFRLRDLPKPRIRRRHVLGIGDVVGGYRVQRYPPYDTAPLLDGRLMHIVFQGYSEDLPEKHLARLTFDTKRRLFEDVCPVCRLIWTAPDGTRKQRAFSISEVQECYRDFGMKDTVATWNPFPVLDKHLVRVGDWYYTCVGCWSASSNPLLVVRTKDALDFEVVFHARFPYGVTEASLEWADESFYVVARTGRLRGRQPAIEAFGGTWLGRFSADGKVIRAPRQIGDVESLPAIFLREGRPWVVVNVRPEYVLESGKKVYRSRVRFSEISPLLEPVQSYEIASPHSIQYYSVNQYKGKYYFTYVNDPVPPINPSWKGAVSIAGLHF